MDVIPFIAAFLGFFAFTLIWGRLVHWALGIWTVIQDRRRSPATRSRARLLAPLLLSSGPWVLIIVIGLSVYFFSKPHDPDWNWLFAGALLALLLMSFSVLRVLRIRRKALAARREAV